MPIYRLVPAAPINDPNWSRALNHGQVIVRAHSTGEARAIAALEEASIRYGGVPPTTTQVVASAFRDEKLYTVIPDTTGSLTIRGPPLSGGPSGPFFYVAVGRGGAEATQGQLYNVVSRERFRSAKRKWTLRGVGRLPDPLGAIAQYSRGCAWP